MATFQLVRDATGRAGLAAALAFAFALVPPFLFYFFQFYPEMPGALVLAVLFRVLFFRDSLSRPRRSRRGLLLAAPALASSEVPARVGRARGHRPRPGLARRARPGASFSGPRRAPGGDALSHGALQLRHRGQRPARRPLPGLGTRGGDHRAAGPGPSRPLAGRALRPPALCPRLRLAGAGLVAGRGRADAPAPGPSRGPRLLPDRRRRRQLGGRRLQPRPLPHADPAPRGGLRRSDPRPRLVSPRRHRRRARGSSR